MMGKILWLDYTKSKKNLLLKISLPFVLVVFSYSVGYGNIALVMILIFTVVTGSGLKIVQMKSNGLYNRLLTAPVDKKRMFLELTSIYSGLYTIQFLPTFAVGVYYDGFGILVFSFLSLLVVILLGTLVGLHAKSLGQIHFNSLVVVLPLVAVAMMDMNLSYLFPFIYVTRSVYSVEGLLLPTGIILGLYLLLISDVSRL
jgi:hypothetical protein